MAGLNINDPITFRQALDSQNIIPGDTLYLRGGTYTGDWTILWSGTEAAPVTIKPYNNEPVTIDGSLLVAGNYISIYDLDFTDSRDRHVVTPGVYSSGLGFVLCGCHIYGVHSSGVQWYGYGVGSVSENWIEDNYYLDATERVTGHGIYSHNSAGGEHFIERNLVIQAHEKYTLHLYSGGPNYLRDYRVRDNVFVGAVQTGGGYGLIDCQYERNVQYRDWCQLGRYIYDQNYQHSGGTIKDNLFIEQNRYSVNEDCNLAWDGLVESGNTVWQYSTYQWPRETGYTTEAKPQTWSRFIPFTISARWSGLQITVNGDTFSAAMVAA